MGSTNKTAAAAATLDNSSLNETELIELIRRQMKQKNITLDSFVDIYDHDDDDDNLNSNGSEGNESDELQEQVIDDDDENDANNNAQPDYKNNRLSTILEASCEESPFKKVTLVNRPSSSAKASLFNAKAQNNKYTKIETVSEENDNDEDDDQAIEQELSQAQNEDNSDEINEDMNEQAEPNNRNPTALDIDSLPIGVKPTNKMSFEQLIEEKLKIADQLEQEQQEMSKIKKKPLNLANINKTRQQFLQAKMAKEAKFPSTAPAQPVVAAKQQPQQPQQQLQQEEPEQPVKQLNREPRRYLRRGEGLKRYQGGGGRDRSKSNSNSKSAKEPPAQKPMSRVTSSSNQLKSASSTTLAPSSQSANPKLKKSISASNMTAAGQKEPPLKKSSSLKSSTSTSSLNPSSKAAKKPEPAAKPKPPTKSSEDLVIDDELSEFEQLEQYVDEHPSFRSTTSFVDAVLTSKKSNYFSTEEDSGSEANLLSNLLSSLSKQQLNSLSSNNKFNLMLSMLNSNQGNKLAGLAEDDETDSSENNNNNNNNSDEINQSELELEKESEKQRRLSENSTTSSKVVVVRKIKRIQNAGNEESSLETHKKISYSCLNYKDDDYNENYNDLVEPEIEQNEDEYFSNDYKMTSSRSSSQERVNETKLKYQPQNKPSQELKFDDASSWSDEQAQDKEKNVSKLIGKLFPSIKEQQEKLKQQKEQEQAIKDKEAFEKLKQQQMSSISSSSNVQADSSLLKQKLAQLEAEIERFQKKNAELAKLKEKCEIEIKLAETNRKLFEKQKEDEMKRMREEHDEESRKLKLEKKIFEEYKKSIKDNPDRRERDDIERLKKQVSFFFFF